MNEHLYSWKDSFAVYLQPRVLTLFFLGFSAGLPFLLVFSTLILWLKTSRLDIAVIGYFSFIGITYSIKVFWAPIVDSLSLPVLTKKIGHRSSWILVSQIGITCGLILMAFTDPAEHYIEIACFALLVAFSSATQDINIDAFRIEYAGPEYQAAMSAMYVFGYRIALLIAGAVALYIAELVSWKIAYLSMAACMSIGIITILIVRNPETTLHSLTSTLMPAKVVRDHFSQFSLGLRLLFVIGINVFLIFFVSILLFFVFLFPVYLFNSLISLITNIQLLNFEYLYQHYYLMINILFITSTLIVIGAAILVRLGYLLNLTEWLLGAIVGPFVDFFHRFGIQIAIMVLALISIYRISDIFMASMAYALYDELGFSLSEIASVTKVFGVAMTMTGAALGGVLVMRYGIMRPLLVGALLVASTTLCFAFLATQGHSLVWLSVVIAADNISGGLATSAFIAYLSALINKSYTATQYALFSSIMTLLPKFLSGFSGEIVAAQGYVNFFILASLIGIPTILLIIALIIKRHAPGPVSGKV